MMSKHFPFVKVWNHTETTIKQMLGMGIPGQSHTIQGQLGLVLTLHLCLGLLVPRLTGDIPLGLGPGIPDPKNSCRYSKGDCHWVGGKSKLCSVTKIHLPPKLGSYFVGKCIYLTKLNSPYTKTLGQYTSSLRIKVPRYFSSKESQVLLCQENLLSKVTVLDQKRQDLSRTIQGCSWCRDVEDMFYS